MDFNSLYWFNLFKMILVGNTLIVQSESRETNLKTILILIISIVLISLLLFRNLFFKSTLLLKSFGELSVDPEIAFTNNKPTFLEFYAEWCEVCREIAPQVSAFKSDYERDINFVFLNVDNQKWGNYIKKFSVNGIPQVNLFDKKGNLISTFIGKQDEIKIRESLNNLEKEEKPYQEIINAEFSPIQENKNNEVSPRSHG
jgi:thiol-disulfide isomerase/thioredoxin